MKSRYQQIAESYVPMADRYGLSEAEWKGLTPEEREVHYNRQVKCTHKYVFSGREELRGPMSFDPYFNTPHMTPCTKEASCDCQMCASGIGVPRDQVKRVDERKVREKLKENSNAERPDTMES